MSHMMEEWMVGGPTEFMRDGNCNGMDTNLFFPRRGEPQTQAMAVCRGTDTKPACPVKDQCLEYALTLPPYLVGIWGGTSQKDRKRIQTERERQRRVTQGLPEGQPIRLRTWSPTS